MTFLVPFALIGSLLLIVPIVAHLFKPRKMKQTPFSSLRWLKESQQRLSRRIQWHQWLLFLLRAGCLALLVLALAKPLIGGAWSGRATDRVIILDVSRSMAYQMPESPSALERARDLARRIAETGQASDRTAVILAGKSPKLATPIAADGSAGVVAIQAARPELADGSLSAALPLVRSLVPRSENRDVELVFLTDDLQGRWQQKDIQAFLKDGPKTAKVKVIDVAAGSANNAWIADARLLQFGDDERWIGVEIGCVGEARPRRLRLTGITGAEDDVREVTPKQGQIVRELFKLPQGLNLQGQAGQFRLEPADALPSDDVFWLNLDAPFALRILLVEPDTAGPDGRAAGVFLHTAMGALNGSKNQTLDVARRTSASVTAGDMQKADVVVLAGVADLTDAGLDALDTRVRGGTGLLLFLGPRLNAAFYQQKMHRPQQPAESLLPMTWKDGASDGKPGTLTNVRWAHPLLSALQDPVLSDFTKSQFRKYYPLTGAPGKGDAILARFDDEVPALIEHSLGAGRVLIVNTSANDEWSDLPRSKSFLPLLDRALAHLSAGGRQRSFTVGDAVSVPAPSVKGSGEWGVLTPSGAKLTPRLVTAPGQTLWHLDEVAEAGVYRIESADEKALVFCVNASRGDSPLRPMDAKALEEWFTPLSVEVLSADTASERLQAPARAWPVWPALIVMASVLLIAETIYVHRLCPRANPKAAAAVVGIMKPVSK
jgi:hypothetical protein